MGSLFKSAVFLCFCATGVIAQTSTSTTQPAGGQALNLAGYQQAALQNPNDPQAWSTLATAAKWNGNMQVEQDALQHLTQLQPPTGTSSGQSWARLGELLRQGRQSNASSNAFQNAVKADPNLANAWHGLGLSQADLGQLNEAVASLKKALALQPKLEQAWRDLANILEQLKRNSDATIARMQAEQARMSQKK